MQKDECVKTILCEHRFGNKSVLDFYKNKYDFFVNKA